MNDDIVMHARDYLKSVFKWGHADPALTQAAVRVLELEQNERFIGTPEKEE